MPERGTAVQGSIGKAGGGAPRVDAAGHRTKRMRGSGYAPADEDDEVYVPDENLYFAIRHSLWLLDVDGWNGPITEGKMLRLTELWDDSEEEIEDLTGLEFAHNLTHTPGLGGQSIRSIRPLRGLDKLEHLNLWGNLITDVGPLRRLSELKSLGLSSNPITSPTSATRPGFN